MNYLKCDQTYFDRKAKDWDNDPEKIERARVLASEIMDYFSDRSIVNAFEYGCGSGLLSFFLKDNFKKITLGDRSKGMLEVLNEKIKRNKIDNFKPVRIDLEKEMINEKFGIIYTLMTLHHIKKLDMIIAKFNQLLEAGGYLCIADLEKEDGTFHSQIKNYDGHYGFDKEALNNLLIKHGFKIDLYKVFYKIGKKIDTGERKEYPLFLVIAQKLAQPLNL
jgi:2-polyprenyl-3-methyl-5-hydroxy-6-metoxy-1,4-benzoquinol methylase